MRAGLDASTDTPGMTAPPVSFTRPTIALCADAAAGHSSATRVAAAAFENALRNMTSSYPRAGGEADCKDLLGEAQARNKGVAKRRKREVGLTERAGGVVRVD